LHLVGILFPHFNDDARSKSHQTASLMLHHKSTTLKQEVFSNPSLGTMVTKKSERCMAGLFKKRHVISIFNNTNKIH